MSEVMDVLVALARQDEDWVGLRRTLEEVPGRLASLDRRMEELRKGAAAARAALDAGRLERRNKESAAQDLETELRRLNSQLPQLKTNEAYTAMLKEISGAKDRKSALETDVLTLMENEEVQVRDLHAAEATLAENTRVVDAERAKIGQGRTQMKERLSAVETERAGLIARLDAGVRSKYERVFANKDGHAVGLVSHNACGGCHATLPPQLLSEVRRREEVRVCETCGRLLAWAGA
jgi:uncharacterized protein